MTMPTNRLLAGDHAGRSFLLVLFFLCIFQFRRYNYIWKKKTFIRDFLCRYVTLRFLTIVPCSNRRPKFSTLCRLGNLSGLDLSGSTCALSCAGVPTWTVFFLLIFPLNHNFPISCRCTDLLRLAYKDFVLYYYRRDAHILTVPCSQPQHRGV